MHRKLLIILRIKILNNNNKRRQKPPYLQWRKTVNKKQIIQGWIQQIIKRSRFRYSYLTAYKTCRNGGCFIKAKEQFAKETNTDSSICGAISYFGRKTDNTFPTANELSVMVDDAMYKRITAHAISQYKQQLEAEEWARNPKPYVEPSQYYPRRG